MLRNTFYTLILFVSGTSITFSQGRKVIPPTAEYIKHLEAAKSHGTTLIKDKKQLDKYVSKGKLVSVKQRGYGFRVTDLTHSHRYLTPRANQTLRDIAREFVKTTGQNFFVVTSLTRTLHDQDRLRGVNGNASSNDSAHNYGASFDISYIRFNHKIGQNSKLDRDLNNILKSFQNSGRIYYVKEKQSSCYHIVVRR
ncbi:DUF5715 family protein [Faecalibacter rhinopitheci]|uniref:Uncharacterized protein n=1 Tax=Faecalibacter rhinopitheci TaxID=2779678 RepID=A0A8J7FPA6_9FLAO|nr:DUF5715 family protein [Faecalibacter rhinopitheci]MBF0598192.1 hypothetical protein [Faecalibacter rhinopitheci]